MNVGELFVTLGFKVDTEKLKEFNDNISNAQKTLVKVSVAAAGAVWAMNRFVAKAVDDSAALKNFESIVGGSADEVQRLHRAAQDFNTTFTLDQAMSTWKSLLDMIREAKDKGTYEEGLLRLGIGNISYDDPMSLMMKLRDARHRYNAEDWKRWIRSLGFDDLIPLLESSDSEFNKAMSQYVPSDSQIDAWYRSAQAIVKFTRTWNDMRMSLGESVSPVWSEFLLNAGATVKWIGGVVEWAAEKWQKLGNHAKNAFQLIGLELMAVASVFFPLLWIPTAATAIILAIDKLGEFLRGKTFLNDLIEDLKAIPNLISNVIDWFEKMAFSLSSKLFKSEEGSPMAEWKKRMSERWGSDKKDTDLGIYPRGSGGTNSTNNQGNLTYAPTYNTTTNADPYQLMDAISVYDQNALNRAMQSIGISGSGMVTGGN